MPWRCWATAGAPRAIAISAQWPDPAPGNPFRYGGAVAPTDLPPAVARRLIDAAEAVASAAGLVGLGSADFLVDGEGGFTLLEINPRPGATLDILDRPGAPPRAHRLRAASRGLCGAAAGKAAIAWRACAGRRGGLRPPPRASVPQDMRWPMLTADLEPAGSRLRARRAGLHRDGAGRHAR
jgi:hypothetical protein